MRRVLMRLLIFILTAVHTLPAHASETLLYTDSVIYTDATTCVHFTIPEGWRLLDTEGPSDSLRVFVCETNPWIIIMYSNVDFWAALPPENRKGFTRSDADKEFFSDAILQNFSDKAADYGVTMYGSETVTYGGAVYFKSVMSPEGADNIINTSLTTMHNGYMHAFAFQGTQNDPLYGDFEAMLESVFFPATAEVQQPSPVLEPLGSLGFPNVIFYTVITAVAGLLSVIIYRHVVRRRAMRCQGAGRPRAK